MKPIFFSSAIVLFCFLCSCKKDQESTSASHTTESVYKAKLESMLHTSFHQSTPAESDTSDKSVIHLNFASYQEAYKSLQALEQGETITESVPASPIKSNPGLFQSEKTDLSTNTTTYAFYSTTLTTSASVQNSLFLQAVSMNLSPSWSFLYTHGVYSSFVSMSCPITAYNMSGVAVVQGAPYSGPYVIPGNPGTIGGFIGGIATINGTSATLIAFLSGSVSVTIPASYGSTSVFHATLTASLGGN